MDEIVVVALMLTAAVLWLWYAHLDSWIAGEIEQEERAHRKLEHAQMRALRRKGGNSHPTH